MAEQQLEHKRRLIIPGTRSLAALAITIAAGSLAQATDSEGSTGCPDADAEAGCASWCAGQGHGYIYGCSENGLPGCGCS
jgi:hypothetical protein